MTSIFAPSNSAANTAKATANTAALKEQTKQNTITSGTGQINNIFDGQFNDDFYNKRQQGYLDYANPQLDQQYEKAKQDLTFSLARSGILDSSARAAKEAELTQKYNTNRQGIADLALATGNEARGSVESARASLIAALNGSGDASGAVSQANAKAQALSAAPAYSPLGQMFGDATSALAVQAAQEKAQVLSGGKFVSPYDTGLFSNKKSIQVSGS